MHVGSRLEQKLCEIWKKKPHLLKGIINCNQIVFVLWKESLNSGSINIIKMSIYLSPLSLEIKRKRHMTLKNRSLLGTNKTNWRVYPAQWKPILPSYVWHWKQGNLKTDCVSSQQQSHVRIKVLVLGWGVKYMQAHWRASKVAKGYSVEIIVGGSWGETPGNSIGLSVSSLSEKRITESALVNQQIPVCRQDQYVYLSN